MTQKLGTKMLRAILSRRFATVMALFGWVYGRSRSITKVKAVEGLVELNDDDPKGE